MSTATTTPPPIYRFAAGTKPVANPPSPMNQAEKSRFRAAAFRACRVYPGPIGQLLSREILATEEFGWATPDSLVAAAVRAIMDQST